MLKVKRHMSESIVYKFEGVDPADGVDAIALADAIGGLTRTLSESACAIGMNGDLSVKVRPFRKGSFIVDMFVDFFQPVVDLLTSQESNAVTNLLAIIGLGYGTNGAIGVVRKLRGKTREFVDNGDGTYTYGDETVSADVHNVLQSSNVAQNLEKCIAGPLIGSIKATSVSVTVVGTDNPMTFSKEDVPYFVEHRGNASQSKNDGDATTSHIMHGIWLNPVSGNYDGCENGYSFVVAGDDEGARYRRVVIEDAEFLSRMASGEVRLFSKDVLKVDLRCDQCVKAGKMATTYAIVKVVEYAPHHAAAQQMLELE